MRNSYIQRIYIIKIRLSIMMMYWVYIFSPKIESKIITPKHRRCKVLINEWKGSKIELLDKITTTGTKTKKKIEI